MSMGHSWAAFEPWVGPVSPQFGRLMRRVRLTWAATIKSWLGSLSWARLELACLISISSSFWAWPDRVAHHGTTSSHP